MFLTGCREPFILIFFLGAIAVKGLWLGEKGDSTGDELGENHIPLQSGQYIHHSIYMQIVKSTIKKQMWCSHPLINCHTTPNNPFLREVSNGCQPSCRLSKILACLDLRVLAPLRRTLTVPSRCLGETERGSELHRLKKHPNHRRKHVTHCSILAQVS